VVIDKEYIIKYVLANKGKCDLYVAGVCFNICPIKQKGVGVLTCYSYPTDTYKRMARYVCKHMTQEEIFEFML